MEAQIVSRKSLAARTEMFASFRLGQTELALSITSLQEVVNYPEKVTLVPLAPDYLNGLFNLRGSVIPVVDMARLLRIPGDSAAAGKKIAIVCVGEVRIGLLFDSTSEILNVPPQDISQFEASGDPRTSVVRSALKLNGGDRLVEVIDVSALLQIENIPQILAQSKNNILEIARKKSKRTQVITFRAGPLGFGLEIASIGEIIRVPEIRKTVLALEYCLGVVNLRGTVIPILDLRKFLQIEGETSIHSEGARIIILKLTENEGRHAVQVGFLVDSVDSIASFFEDEILPIPLFRQRKIEMMRGLVSHQKAGDVILLNAEKVLSNDEVLEITRGHDSLFGQKSDAQARAQALTASRRPYLSFRLDTLFSVPLKSVDEIAIPDQQLIRPPGFPDFVAGMMKMRGEAIVVVDLRTYYKLGAIERAAPRVLVVKSEKAKFGLLVDAVESIDTLDEAQKVDLPMFSSAANAAFKGDLKGLAEMVDSNGEKRSFMIMDMAELLRKFDALIS